MSTQSATERGVNPFDQAKTFAVNEDGGAGHSYDARAKGIDGDMLDAMMKGRWEEGHATGYQDGHQAARLSYPQIYDDGFAAGHQTGVQETGTALASRLLPLIEACGQAFLRISEKTGSAEIKAIVEGLIPQIRETLDREVGAYSDASARMVAEQLAEAIRRPGAGTPTP